MTVTMMMRRIVAAVRSAGSATGGIGSVAAVQERFGVRGLSASAGAGASAVEEEKLDYGGMDEFVDVGHKLADAARNIIMKYFRSGFQIIDKEDKSKSN